MTQIRSWANTNAGAVRKHNEDNLLSRPELGLWAVADGAGGHNSGEVASAMIVEALQSLAADLSAADLLAQIRTAIAGVHQRLQTLAAATGPGVVIASTFLGLMIRDGHFAVLWAGDSRAYLLRQGKLQQLSQDHSLVQELVDLGALTPEQAESHPQSNVITRAVGAGEEELVLDKVIGTTEPGDRFLLCSDGLSKTLTIAEITSLLAVPAGAAPDELLITAALAHHVTDNVTAVVVEVPAE
jgi:protein phosphatase/serine/threonine-protein phosphatase Stp1